MIQAPGIKLYCLGSVDDRTVGFTDLLMTTASTVLDNVDVTVIGLKSLSNTVAEMSGMTPGFQARRHLHSGRKSSRYSDWCCQCNKHFKHYLEVHIMFSQVELSSQPINM